jgi:predicted DNA-binding protein
MSQVRVSENTHELLRSLSSQEGKSMQDIIDKAIEDYRRKAFLQGVSNDYRLLRENPEAWKEHEEDMALWDNTSMDGLDNE